jgi:integrase
MPRIKLTKTSIDSLAAGPADVVYWDASLPGFGVKVTPKHRKVFIVLYRTGGAGTKLRKYTIGPYGRLTLHQARIAAQKVFAAKLEGRDPAAEKRESKRRIVTEGFAELLETFIAQKLSRNKSGKEIARLLRREFGKVWEGRSVHDLKKRDVVDAVCAIEQRGAPAAANKALKSINSYFRWAVGRALIERSPAEGIPLPAKVASRDRVLDDNELAAVILAVRQMRSPYSGIVELLALTGQRREEVAQMTWDEVDFDGHLWTIPKQRTKNSKTHLVHLSSRALLLLRSLEKRGPYVFQVGERPFAAFSLAKRELDEVSGVTSWRVHDLRRTCVSGMARLKVAPHVADKVINHQAGTISGVAAVYQRHEFLTERKEALDRWGEHVENVVNAASRSARTLKAA